MNNQVIISGEIVKVYPLKKTLSNIPVMSFVLEHRSRQVEAGFSREVKCRLYCIMIDPKKYLDISLANRLVEVKGFLSQNSKTQLVLHINHLEFLDRGI